MNIKLKKIFPIAFGILILSFLVYPQIRESGKIQGHVTDEGGVPLPGVTVTTESPNLIGGPQSTVTDADGFYRFRSLSIGEYKVTAGLSGFNTMVEEGISLHAGYTLTVDFKMTQATVKEEVVVIGKIPTVDIKSAKAGAIVLTDEFLLSIPAGKSYAALSYLAPGDDFQSPYGGGYGSTNAWQFDGVDVSSPSWGGVSFTPDFNVIKEAAVMGLGLPAEYGHFTGAVMTAVSKSGSNRFSTLNEFLYQGKGWNSQNWKQVPGDEWYPSYKPASDYKYKTLPSYVIGMQFGGKLIQDKLWLFVSGEYNRQWQEVMNLPDIITETPKIFGKLTYQLNASNKINLSGTWFKKNTSGGGSVLYPEGLYQISKSPQHYGNLSWTSMLSSATFLDVKLGFYKYAYFSRPSFGLDIAGGIDRGTGMYIDNLTTYSESESWTYNINAQLNHYVPEFIKGSHDFKLGTEFAHFKIVSAGGAPGDAQLIYRFGEPQEKTYVPPYSHDNYATEFTGFIQDTWSVTKRLTLNLGLRYDHYWYRIPDPTRGVVYSTAAFSPRVGLTYDLLGDRKNVVKLHYAHYVENINRNQFYSRFDPRRYVGPKKYKWDPVAQDWVFWYEITYPEIAADVGQNVTHPWIREIIGGFERELFRDASLAINFYNRSIGAAFYAFNIASQYAPITVTNPGPDNRAGTSDDLGPVDAWYNTNPGVYTYQLMNVKKGSPEWMTEDLKWYCRGIEVIFSKKFSNRWSMITSYHYTVSKGNTSGAMNQIYDPNYLINAYGEQGGGYYSQPHQLKIQGNVLLPVVDVDLGITARAMSGRQWPQTFRVRTPGGNITIKAGPPGQIKRDSRYDLNVRVQKIFRIRGWKLTVIGDIFNALNNHDGNNGIYWSYGPLYRYRTSIKGPRTYTIGFRIIY